jgi:hypothetical protein
VRKHKVCARCRRGLPIAAFRQNEHMRFGIDSWCRECHNEATRAWRARHPERVAEINAARREGPWLRTCAGCGARFPGKRRNAKWCPNCRSRRRTISRTVARATGSRCAYEVAGRAS